MVSYQFCHAQEKEFLSSYHKEQSQTFPETVQHMQFPIVDKQQESLLYHTEIEKDTLLVLREVLGNCKFPHCRQLPIYHHKNALVDDQAWTNPKWKDASEPNRPHSHLLRQKSPHRCHSDLGDTWYYSSVLTDRL